MNYFINNNNKNYALSVSDSNLIFILIISHFLLFIFFSYIFYNNNKLTSYSPTKK